MGFRRLLRLIAAAAMICAAGTAFAQEPAPSANSRGYLIGPGDVIEGKVLGEPDFNFTATVFYDTGFLKSARHASHARTPDTKHFS